MKITKFQSQVAAMIQQVREAPGIPTFWLPVSYVMAHVEIESGFDPNIYAGDYQTTGSAGLMQVERATAGDIQREYAHLANVALNSDGSLNQLDAYTSIVTGMLYLRTCYNYLLPIFKAPLAYRHVCMAYNEGPGNAGKGIQDTSYYYKWLSAQVGFSALDSEFMV
jgi:soluble lytic murein transglycosylase-like protein